MEQHGDDDPERLPVPSSDSDESSDLEEENVNLSGLEDDVDSNYSEGDGTDSHDTDDENYGENDNDRGSYIVRGEEGAEYLLPLDDMNENELQDLLEELEMNTEGDSLQQPLYPNLDRLGKSYYDESGMADIYDASCQQQCHSNSVNASVNTSLLYPSLHVLEIIFYFCAFWMGATFSLYRFYNTSQKLAMYLPLSNTPDSFLGRHRDDTDIEWYVWPQLLLPRLHWAVVHGVLAQLVRKHAQQHLCLFYIVWSCAVINWAVGPVGLVLCLSIPALLFTVLLTRNKQLVWGAWCLILLLFNVEPVTSSLEQLMSPVAEGDYKVSVIVAWIILRSLSYSLETCDADPDNSLPVRRQLLTLLAYCLYLPFLFTGPYMPYVDFLTGLNAPYRPWTLRRALQALLQLARFAAWAFVATALLHQMYAHALHWSPQLVVRLNTWALAGFMYYLIVFFVIKYVVLYGFPGAVASIEGYSAPPPPKCVLLLCRFSRLWRDFDHGLYLFMTRHIYLPWVSVAGQGFLPKLQATVLVFTFVYVWHGVTPQVLLWAALNFLGVLLERAGDAVAARPGYRAWEARRLSPRWQRRWHALLSALLLAPSVLSLAVFLTSLENAATVARRALQPVPALTFTVFMYCLAHVSFEVHNWKVRAGRSDTKVK